LGLLAESEKRHWKKVVRAVEESLAAERRRSQRLDYELTHNPETGMPNAVVLHRELESILEADARPKALMFLALSDSFGMLKRTFSTKISEWILFQTGLRIQKVLEDRGRVYHTHEDEFLILVEHFQDPVEILEMAKRLVDKVEQNHSMQGKTISLQVNLGISFYPDDGRKKAVLLRHADIALSEAVKNKLDFLPFTPELKERMVEAVELQNDMLRALEAQADPEQAPQFELYYHPQVEVRHWGTPRVQGRVVGAEALLRWKHPVRGFVPPSKFIALAEQTGLIVPLGQFVLHTATSALLDMARRGLPRVPISVNLSNIQFNNVDVADQILSLVKRRGVDPTALKLEITESGLMDNVADTIHKTNLLREAGFKILVDDFGTGYSSLSYLKVLPVDVVKVDKSFIDGVPDNPSDRVLSKAIVDLARSLNLGIIVEGTERRPQIDWLFDQGCTIFQGYYFSKPLPYEDFLTYIRDFPAKFGALANRG